MLKLFNITDDQVHLFKGNWYYTIYLMLISFFRLILSLIFVIPGNIMILPLSNAIAFYAERERIAALKTSTVKIKAYDVLSSIKVLSYLSTYPVYVCLFTFVFNRVLRWYYGLERADSYYYTFIFFVVFPIVQLISIRSHDGVRTHYSDF